ncbi:MAG: imidazoleglycerol-phosphate dehydratase HisB [Thermodesulfobacteriota bacterium]
MSRKSEIHRKTLETDVHVVLDLDKNGKNEISTKIPFFDHMLDLFSKHGNFNFSVKAHGDIEVDYHHTVEDIGIAAGAAFKEALGDKKGIARYGNCSLPMDETLANTALDISGRPYLVYNMPNEIHARGSFSPYLAKEFFRAFVLNSGITLHINVLYGENEHHIIEAVFKSFAKALAQACRVESQEIPSTKGILQ